MKKQAVEQQKGSKKGLRDELHPHRRGKKLFGEEWECYWGFNGKVSAQNWKCEPCPLDPMLLQPGKLWGLILKWMEERVGAVVKNGYTWPQNRWNLVAVFAALTHLHCLCKSLCDFSFPQSSLPQLFRGSDHPGAWQTFDSPLSTHGDCFKLQATYPSEVIYFFFIIIIFYKCCLQQVVHVNSILIKGEESVLHNSYPRFSWESENSPEGLMKRPAKSVASQMGDLILICLRFSQAVWLALGWLTASEVELRQRGCLDFPEALIWGSG